MIVCTCTTRHGLTVIVTSYGYVSWRCSAALEAGRTTNLTVLCESKIPYLFKKWRKKKQQTKEEVAKKEVAKEGALKHDVCLCYLLFSFICLVLLPLLLGRKMSPAALLV